SIDTIEALIQDERIDCSFRRTGKLKFTSKPQHFQAIARNFEALHAEVDPDTALLSADDPYASSRSYSRASRRGRASRFPAS
ncbi:hypothetical protein ACCS66_38475, partial [Rhizobium ruizarguesonis]